MFSTVVDSTFTLTKNQYEGLILGCGILGFIIAVVILWILWLLFQTAVRFAARNLVEDIAHERDRRWEDDKELDKRVDVLEKLPKAVSAVVDRLEILEDWMKERRTPHDKPKDI